MNIYTKAGDNGRSSTLTRTSLPKNSPVFELLGTLDELNSQLGTVKLQTKEGIKTIIEALQSDLITLSGEIAGTKKFATREEIKKLEKSIDSVSGAIPEFSGFTLPGATKDGAILDVCRTVARRAERAAVAAQQRGGITKELLAWLNRLSDLLYVLARLCDANASTGGSSTTSVSGNLEGFCDKAIALCAVVREYARSRGVKAVVAVCDAGGNAVCMQREDDAYIASIDIAVNKAFTSASLKMTTEEVGKLAVPGAPLYGIQNTNGGKIVIFGGGVPLMKNGAIVGALGVSGGSAELDTVIADFGAIYFEKEM